MDKYCSNCGAKLNEGADVCIKCGKMINKNKGINLEFAPDGGRNRLIAILLAIFCGTLGIHSFYLGYTSKGVIQLLLTIVGWIIFIGPFISAIWAIIDLICLITGNLATDANGKKLV